MNLGQLIGGLLIELDNEREAKFLQYHPRKAESFQKRIMDALTEHPEKASWLEIQIMCNVTEEERQPMLHALGDLHKHKHLSRDGTRRKYRYWITRRA